MILRSQLSDKFHKFTQTDQPPSNYSSSDEDDYCTDDESVLDQLLFIHKNSKKRKVSDSKSFIDTLNQEEYLYYTTLEPDQQKSIRTRYECIYNNFKFKEPLKFKILSTKIDDYSKNIALSKLNMLNNMDDCSQSEYFKNKKWIDTFCDIPFGVYKKLSTNNIENVPEYLEKTQHILDNKIYGHNDAKHQIMRIIGQWISNPLQKGNVIGIHGNPGVGKTTLVKDGLANILEIPFVSIPLGGTSDSSYLVGHSYTYEGSSCGKIIDIVIQSKCMNPIIYFDELDKVSDSARGEEIYNTLIHLTDPSQNYEFKDKYFSEINFDLSSALIIFTFNDIHKINPILLDRMITIQTKDYSLSDKIKIANKFLIPRVFNDFNINIENMFTNDIITYIIKIIPNEHGVRNLKRAIENIISNINLHNLTNEKKVTSLDIHQVNSYLSIHRNPMETSLHHLYT